MKLLLSISAQQEAMLLQVATRWASSESLRDDPKGCCQIEAIQHFAHGLLVGYDEFHKRLTAGAAACPVEGGRKQP